MKRYFLILVFFLVVAVALPAVAVAANHKTTPSAIPLLSLKDIQWTSEEIDYIKALHKKGSMTIATKISSSVYMPEEDGSISGFHYRMLKKFADLAGINIKVELVSWSDYFYREGEDLERVKSDPDYGYVPTLFQDVDIFLDGFTAIPWREQLFDIIKFVPTRQMLISRKDNKPQSISDLDGKTFAMMKDTSMLVRLESIKQAYDFDFKYVFTDDFENMEELVSQGKADFTVYDSDRAFRALGNFNNLDIVWPISDAQMMGWAIDKKDRVLKSILEKYIEYAQANNILDENWRLSYGVTFVEYMNILKLAY